ncbi:MAG: peptide chain release factor N(5)-glutamine methyltransferase [Patescibacteria group bacterium]
MHIEDIYKKYSVKIDYLDLELLIASSIGKSREFALAHPECRIPATRNPKLRTLIRRRMKDEPLAYILGQKEFYGLNFKVNQNTLIPRPETELLVEKVLELNPKNATIIDVGTGTGNIIISLAKNLKERNKFMALDISSKAVSVAKQNAKLHKVDKKIKFLKGNLLEPILKSKNYNLKTKNLVVVTNLPYLDTDWKNLLPSSDTQGLRYEPRIALYAGKDGLDAYRKLAKQIKLLKGKTEHAIAVFCEVGPFQTKEMRKIFSFAKRVGFSKDLAGKWRVCKIQI